MQHDSELRNAAMFNDLDGVLEMVTPDEIADAWCRFAAAGPDGLHGPDGWAWWVFQCPELSNRSELFRELLVKIVARVREDRLGAVGAGPLEFFFSSKPDDLAWLAEQARNSERFRTAMASLTWMDEATVRVLVDEGRWTSTWMEPTEEPPGAAKSKRTRTRKDRGDRLPHRRER